MLRIFVSLGLLGYLACGGEAPEPSQPVAAGAPAPELASALDPSCVPPPECRPIATSFVNIGVCCSETLRCGFDLSILVPVLPTLTDADPNALNFDPARPCTPRSFVFLDAPGLSEQRVPAERGDVLTTPECRSRVVVNTQLAGCCLPSGACGYSTHLAAGAFAVLAGSRDYPFTAPECVSAAELNAQLEASTLTAWAHVPPAAGSCDYAGLAARLP